MARIMPAIFEYHHTVADDEIDGLGHANNVCYVRWMQDAAVAHSIAQGWPAERYRWLGSGWVVRSHNIVYHQPAQAGDSVVIETWVATMKRVTSLRRYRILRAASGSPLPRAGSGAGGEGCLPAVLLATAETNWAYINFATGQPTRVPAEVARAFQVVDRFPSPAGRGQGQGELG